MAPIAKKRKAPSSQQTNEQKAKVVREEEADVKEEEEEDVMCMSSSAKIASLKGASGSSLEMAKETRSHNLEKRMGEVSHKLKNLRQSSEAQFEQKMQLIRAISIQNQEKLDTATSVPEGEGESHVEGIKNHWGNSTRLEFPKFDGKEFDGWLIRAEYFFEVAELKVEEWVKIVALHF